MAQMTRRIAASALGIALMTDVAFAQTADERGAAREVLNRRSDAIVSVMGTLKARMSQAGRDRPAPDQAVQASATVLDGSGLTVLALSSIDPGTLMARNPAFTAAQMKIETELTELKLRLGDGSEIPARIALRDSDLDLLFIRPATAPEKPMTAVDANSPMFNPVDPVVLVQRLGEVAAWKASAGIGTIEVVVDRPRRFYLFGTTAAANGLGSAIFDLKGQFAGIVTLRQSSDARHNALNGMQGGLLQTLGMVAAIIPAADIRDIAKQATAR
jgi:hypothetical protein